DDASPAPKDLRTEARYAEVLVAQYAKTRLTNFSKCDDQIGSSPRRLVSSCKIASTKVTVRGSAIRPYGVRLSPAIENWRALCEIHVPASEMVPKGQTSF